MVSNEKDLTEIQSETENPDQNFKMFKSLWFGQLVSLLGSEIVQFALVVWLAIETKSAIIMSLSMFLVYIPVILVGPIAGVLVDRWDKKKVLVITDSLQAIATVSLIVIFYFEAPNIWFILGLNFIRAIFQAFHRPSFVTVISLMVPKDKLSRVNGFNQLMTALVYMIGPLLGALVLSIWTIQIILWIDVITFIIAVIFLLLVKIPKTNHISKKEQSEQSFKEQFKEGLKYIRDSKGLSATIGLAMLANFLLMPINTLFVLFILVDHLGTEMDLAIVSAAMQLAIVAGAILTSIKKNWKNKSQIFLLGILFLFIGIIIIGIAPYQYFWVMVIGSFIGFLGVPILNAMMMTIIQLAIPPEAMGRVSSILGLMSSIASPIGILLSGPLAELIGIKYLFLSSGILGILVVVLTYAFGSIRKLDLN